MGYKHEQKDERGTRWKMKPEQSWQNTATRPARDKMGDGRRDRRRRYGATKSASLADAL